MNKFINSQPPPSHADKSSYNKAAHSNLRTSSLVQLILIDKKRSTVFNYTFIFPN